MEFHKEKIKTQVTISVRTSIITSRMKGSWLLLFSFTLLLGTLKLYKVADLLISQVGIFCIYPKFSTNGKRITKVKEKYKAAKATS